MRRSKALDETVLKRLLNFQNEVTCQVKVRSKVKIGGFQVTGRETSKLAGLGPGPKLSQILLNHRGMN